jgi:hypothetical protein
VALTRSEKATFWRITARVRREWRTSQGSLPRSSLISATSAVSAGAGEAFRFGRLLPPRTLLRCRVDGEVSDAQAAEHCPTSSRDPGASSSAAGRR